MLFAVLPRANLCFLPLFLVPRIVLFGAFSRDKIVLETVLLATPLCKKSCFLVLSFVDCSPLFRHGALDRVFWCSPFVHKIVLAPTSLCGVLVFDSVSSPSSSSSPLLRLLRLLPHNFVTHTTWSHRSLSHTTVSHTTLSPQLCHSQLCHTPSFTDNFVTHTHTHFCYTRLGHTVTHTHLCQHNCVTHATLSRTTLSHTTLSHTFQLCHTHILVTYNFVTHTHTHICRTQLCHAPSLHGRRGTWRHSPALLRGRRGTWRHRPLFCVAAIGVTGMALVALDLALVARLVAVSRPGHRGTLRGRRGNCSHPPSFCVAGVALGDIYLRLAWQAWQLWHWADSGGGLGRR